MVCSAFYIKRKNKAYAHECICTLIIATELVKCKWMNTNNNNNNRVKP